MDAIILTIVVALAILVGLLICGAPIFVGFLTVNIIGVLYYFGPRGFGLFANSIFSTATTDTSGGRSALHPDGRIAVSLRRDGGAVQLGRSADRSRSEVGSTFSALSCLPFSVLCPAQRWLSPDCWVVRFIRP